MSDIFGAFMKLRISQYSYSYQIDVAVNAPEPGTIKEFLAKEEDTVAVGQDLLKLELGGAPSSKGGEGKASSEPKAPASEEQPTASDDQPKGSKEQATSPKAETRTDKEQTPTPQSAKEDAAPPQPPPPSAAQGQDQGQAPRAPSQGHAKKTQEGKKADDGAPAASEPGSREERRVSYPDTSVELGR